MDDGRAEVAGSHHARATYRPNMSVGIAWGYRVDADWDQRVTPDWVREAHIPTSLRPNATSTFCTTDLIYRDYYYVIDGGRVYMPAPSREDDRLMTRREDAMVRLLNDIEQMPYRDSYDSYTQRAGFEVV